MGEHRTIHFVSLGCAKNRVDTEVMLGVSGESGFQIVSDPAEADVIVVNTHLYGTNLLAGGAVLPEHDVVVFDEAHQLEDVISETCGLEIHGRRFDQRVTGRDVTTLFSLYILAVMLRFLLRLSVLEAEPLGGADPDFISTIRAGSFLVFGAGR